MSPRVDFKSVESPPYMKEATPTTTVGILRPLIYGGDSTDLNSTRNIV